MYTNAIDFEQRRHYGSGRTRLIGTLFVTLMMLLIIAGRAGAAVDKSPQFVNPLNGSLVEGAMKVLVYAPQYAQFNAEFGVDGKAWRPMVSEEPGVFTVDWDSTEVSRGKHTLTARFRYGGERPPEAAISITVWVVNGPDGQAGMLPLPCINLLKPVACAAPPAG